MDVYFRLGIILIAAIVILLLLIDAWFSERRTQMAVKSDDHYRDDVDHHFNDVYDKTIQNAPAHIISDLSDPSFHAQSDAEHTFAMNHPEETFPTDIKKEAASSLQDLLVINVIAKNGAQFASYDLLQSISATGMQYGAMNIFHYYEHTSMGRFTLFSLASATEPGEFDLNHMGDFSCAGLTLFMNIRQVPDAIDAFEIMLDTAEQLADDLGGELQAGPYIPWSNEIKQQYQKKVLMYQNLL